MRKAITLLLSVLLACSSAACGKQETENIFPESLAESPADTEGMKDGGDENEGDTEGFSKVGNEAEQDGASEQQSVQEPAESTGDSNTLIVYFSRYGNTEYPDDVDATASAGIVADGTGRYGTTEYIANMIQQTVGGNVHRIETVTPYTEDFDELRDVNHEEMNQNVLPELKMSNLDIEVYDKVFIGYPVWAVRVPQAVLSFLAEYDLSGKTVIPFCTHDGYGAGSTYQQIEQASHAAVSPDGIAIEAKDVPAAQETVNEWLERIGVPGSPADSIGSVAGDSDSAEQAGTPIQITIGDTVLKGILYDTALAEEIKGYFPLTISAVGYGGREYYGGVDFYPEHLEGGQKNFENGDITYCEAHHNMAIFYAQTDNPDLSVDVIPIGRVTSDLSVFGSLDSREDITFSLAQ